MLPLYVSDAEQKNFLPTTVDTATGRRMDAEIPLRTPVPSVSLVYMEDVRCVCPDPTHMLTRCVENDLRRIAQKVVDTLHPYSAEPIKRLEENLTAREAKKPTFSFSRTTPQKGPGKVSNVSLSGTAALTVIADTEELQAATSTVTDLFAGVWGDTIVGGTTQAADDDTPLGDPNDSATPANNQCVAVLKSMFPELFIRRNPLNPRAPAAYISFFDASELLRKSLNRCVLLLRTSKDGLDVAEFSKWAEAYYQCTLLLFGSEVRLA